MKLSRVILTTGVLIPLLSAGAGAQTALADRQPVQQPSLQDQLDTVAGKIAGNVSDLRSAVILYANQAGAYHQQLAEAQQQIVTLTKQRDDAAKERDDLKAKETKTEVAPVTVKP